VVRVVCVVGGGNATKTRALISNMHHAWGELPMRVRVWVYV
jgi:hypothetical protein